MDRGSLRAFFFMERKGEYITFSMDKKDEYLRLINFKSKLAVSSAGADNSVVQTKAALTRDSGLIKMVPVKMVGTADTGLRDAKAAFHKAGIDLEDARAGRNKASVLQRDLATRQVELDTARNDLALKTGAAQGATDLTVAMPLLVLDRTGLSCAGALLAFARCTDAPVLLDSATGNVVLYFHGVNDQFFAAYLDTFVIPSTQELPVDGSAVLFTARDAGLDLGALTITVSDGDAPVRPDHLRRPGGRDLALAAHRARSSWSSAKGSKSPNPTTVPCNGSSSSLSSASRSVIWAARARWTFRLAGCPAADDSAVVTDSASACSVISSAATLLAVSVGSRSGGR